MPMTARIVRFLVIGLPLAFLVYAWTSAASVPVLPENDVSFVSVLDARSSDMEVPRAYVSMAQRPVEGQQAAGGSSFAQLPSVPYLLQYLLMGAGLRDASTQAFIISLIGTALTAVLLWRLFAQPALVVVPLAVVLDYAGFLTWTLNASRIWMFVLFFALVLTVRLNKAVWFGALAFCLIQFDYRIATFVGVTVLTFAMFLHKAKGLRSSPAGLLGAGLPLAIFCLEVLTFHGWDDLLHEVGVGRDWLGTLLASRDGFGFLYRSRPRTDPAVEVGRAGDAQRAGPVVGRRRADRVAVRDEPGLDRRPPQVRSEADGERGRRDHRRIVNSVRRVRRRVRQRLAAAGELPDRAGHRRPGLRATDAGGVVLERPARRGSDRRSGALAAGDDVRDTAAASPEGRADEGAAPRDPLGHGSGADR